MNGKAWTDHERVIMRTLFPHNNTEVIAKVLDRGYKSVCSQAYKMGIHKDPRFLKSDLSGRMNHCRGYGLDFRFKKGHIPANKGKKMTDYLTPDKLEKICKNQFKKGSIPKNHKPVGSIRLDKKDNFILIKIQEGLRNWKHLHRVIWEKNNGPIPKGHVIRFKDGDHGNFDIQNLIMVTRIENMKMNSVHKVSS